MDRKTTKQRFRSTTIPLLIQQLLFFLTGVVAIFIILMVVEVNSQTPIDSDRMIDEIFSNGFILLLSSSVAFIPILISRKRKFITEDLGTKNKSLNLKTGLLWFVVLLTLSMILSQLPFPVELLMNQLGFTILPVSEGVEVATFAPFMLLYTILIGPIFEELIYRGAVLRGLQKFGTGFAIVTSGILFGLMHGNFLQIPSTIVIGILFGYIAVNYSIKATILLHIANNAFSEVFNGFLGLFTDQAGNIIFYSFLILMAIVTTIIVMRQKSNIKKEISKVFTKSKQYSWFFASIPVFLILAYDLFQVFSSIAKL